MYVYIPLWVTGLDRLNLRITYRKLKDLEKEIAITANPHISFYIYGASKLLIIE